MNQVKLLATLLCIFIFNACGWSQEKREIKREVQKEVRVEDENGMLKVIVVTTENGKKSEEVFTGEQAKLKLEELEKGEQNIPSNAAKVENKTRQVKVIEENGVKTVVVSETENGKTTVKQYKGEEAERIEMELKKNK